MQENILGNAVNFLWKRNRRGRQGTAFRDAWQTRLFRLGWRLESASITKYMERKTNVYLRSLSGEAPTYLVSTHFCSSVHSFRRLPPATQLQLDRRWGTMITEFFSLYFNEAFEKFTDMYLHKKPTSIPALNSILHSHAWIRTCENTCYEINFTLHTCDLLFNFRLLAWDLD